MVAIVPFDRAEVPMMRIRTLSLTTAVVAVLLAGASPLSADAATLPHYASCAVVHQHWSGGIARNGVTMNTVHHRNGTVTKQKLKGSVKWSTALYNANARLDADHDGVACEKS